MFSLRLSNPIDHPVGTFSVRDGWEPLRNYLFKRSRDDPATIPEVSDTCHYHELKLHKKKTRTLIGSTNRFIQANFAVMSGCFSVKSVEKQWAKGYSCLVLTE